MRILLTGAAGFLGPHVRRQLEAGGHEVWSVSRKRSASPTHCDWSEASLARGVNECDAVCHLAGEPVLGRWSQKRKEAILNSRVESTARLAKLLAQKGSGSLVQASAVGFYGPTGEALVDESSPNGTDFLSEVCREWERAAEPARQAGLRVAAVRIGVVLGSEGGALKRMLLPFKLGLGGRLGNGRQYFPWVHVNDLARLFRFLLESDQAAGSFNACAPQPLSNAEFSACLAKLLKRPACLPVPAFVLRALMGEAASMLLTGQRALPKRALEAGFEFEHPELEGALRDLLRAAP